MQLTPFIYQYGRSRLSGIRDQSVERGRMGGTGRFWRFNVLGLLVVLTLSACQDPEAVFPETPRIEFLSMEPLILNPDDSLCISRNECFRITFRYEDGDGDLGDDSDAGPNNLFIEDTREDLPYDVPPVFYDGKFSYRLPQSLTPDARNLSIQGTISVAMPLIQVLYPPFEPETTRFDIYIVDRAGNQSNTITTDELVILP